MKQTHDLVQGSDAWHQFRLDHCGASEAAAMLGMSPKVKRAELLRAKHTGLAREFSDWLQRNVLDKGHEVEALARPHIEAIVGESLYPVTMSDGPLSASCDGLTLADDIAAEHKQWAERLAASVRAGIVPDEHMPQCQQVLMVTGADRLIFVVSDGTPERMVYVWVYPHPQWFLRLREGWAQFERDLAAYVLPDSAEPSPVGKAPETLPALFIELKGEVTASNLAEFKATALAAISSVNRDLKTDADFADADKAIKWCGDIESRLAAAKEHALSQTASIDALFKALDDIAAESKRVRLDLTKVVDRRKVEVREQAIVRARSVLDKHIATLTAEIAPMRLPAIAADFAGAIKGKRTVASMQDALDGVLAVAKIAAEADARAIRANLAAFKERAAGFEFLFADLAAIVHKAADDFGLLVQARIDGHRAAEAEKARRAAEAEAQRIAAAEQRAREQEAERIAAEQAHAERLRLAGIAAVSGPSMGEKIELARKIADDIIAVETLREAIKAPPRPDEPATLNLGAICSRLGFTVSAQFLVETLHIAPAKTDKRASLYTESQFARICSQLVSHVSAMAELYAGETA